MFAKRRNSVAFWLGSAAVAAGVLLHLPMVWMARDMGFMLASMPMDSDMLWGMALIVAGIGLACYGLLPKPIAAMLTYEAISHPRTPVSRVLIGC
jgi:putative MFS transporter